MSKTFKVIWSGAASADLEGIIVRIAEESPANALKTLSKIKTTTSGLFRYPNRGRFVPELQEQGILIYRELVIPPWRVAYRVSDSCVLVLSVIDSRQNIEDVLLKRLLNRDI